MRRRITGVVLTILLLLGSGTQVAAADSGAQVAAVDRTDAPPSEAVRVAIIDTGVDLDKGLLDEARVAPGQNYAFPEDGTDDLIGHGTRIAGIILGTTDGIIVGAGPDALLVPLVYYSKYPSGVPLNGGVAALCSAVYDAVDIYGCRVINISSGLPEDDPELAAAIAYAEEAGIIVVSAVGNDNSSAPDRVYYPAAYETVVGVGAFDPATEGPASFSQRGPALTVLAPGMNLTTLSIRNSAAYETISGTSYSSAYVSGLAATALAQWPDMTPAQFRGLLQSNCRDLGPAGWDADSGWGLVDPEATLSAAKAAAATPSPAPARIAASSDGITYATDSPCLLTHPIDKAVAQAAVKCAAVFLLQMQKLHLCSPSGEL